MSLPTPHCIVETLGTSGDNLLKNRSQANTFADYLRIIIKIIKINPILPESESEWFQMYSGTRGKEDNMI